MINLLPPEERRQLVASRTNSLLLRYNVAMIGVLAFVGLALGVTFVYLSNTQATAEKQVAESKNRVANYKDVQQQETTFKSNLSTAKQILDKEIVYTKAILTLAKMLPKGVVLQSLDLDAQTFGTQTVLTFQAKSVDDTLELKRIFQESDLFTNAHFQDIDASGGTGEYPVTVNMNVTISKDIALSKDKE
jgi:Tfp pilus assembly protein PilN